MTTRNSSSERLDASSGWNPLTLAVLASLWLAALPNWPLWRALGALPETATPRGALFIVGFGLMIAALLTAMLSLFAWRASIKPAIAFLLIAAALGAHFMGAYGVVIDTTMMTNVVQTDLRELRDLMNLRLLASVLVLAGLPITIIWRLQIDHTGLLSQGVRNAAGLIASLLLLGALLYGLFADLSTTMRNHRSMRYLINPVNSLYALVDLSKGANAKPSGPPLPIGRDAHIVPRAADSKPPMLVLVIGETARADHFSLNGYARPTNRELPALDVLSFRNVRSCGTNTAASLPCMLSPLGKTAFEARKQDRENLLDLVQRAGMAVLWVDNQAGCKGLCDRVPNAHTRDAVADTSPLDSPPLDFALCDGDECLDAALLQGLDARIAALPATAREHGVLVVLHQMGSHGPAYFKRSAPDRKWFKPECETTVLQQCDHASLLNAYDNSIAYTDHVLAQTVQWLKQQESAYRPALLYVSDHGESLGENNLYLHGLPYSVAPVDQKHVPMVLWLSQKTLADTHTQMQCLREQLDTALSHDNLFHSTLGLLGIQASEYIKQLDAFAPCRTQ